MNTRLLDSLAGYWNINDKPRLDRKPAGLNEVLRDTFSLKLRVYSFYAIVLFALAIAIFWQVM